MNTGRYVEGGTGWGRCAGSVKMRYHGIPGIGGKLLRAGQRERKSAPEGHRLREKAELREHMGACRVGKKEMERRGVDEKLSSRRRVGEAEEAIR